MFSTASDMGEGGGGGGGSPGAVLSDVQKAPYDWKLAFD